MANISASVAEWERQIISQRTKDHASGQASAGSQARQTSPTRARNRREDQIRAQCQSNIAGDSGWIERRPDHYANRKGWSPALVRKITLQVAA